uniref:Uncharacterized protein n=1 Tax=Amphimedon queenslandica TaxID=400682 RepID=A0A1X7VHD1_AMPQE
MKRKSYYCRSLLLFKVIRNSRDRGRGACQTPLQPIFQQIRLYCKMSLMLHQLYKNQNLRKNLATQMYRVRRHSKHVVFW